MKTKDNIEELKQSTIEDLKQHRQRLRRDNDIEAVLELANNLRVTLVELEEASKRFVSRYDEIQESLKGNRHKLMLTARARNAARVRWGRAKAFLTSHIERKEKIKRDFGGVEMDLGTVIVPKEPVEKTYIDEVL